MVAYADDLALISRWKFINTVSDVLQNGLNIVAKWARDSGLSVKPGKTKLPVLDGVTLSLSEKVKFLLWIYDAVVKPILLYGVVIWRNAIDRAILEKKMERLHRVSLLTLSGALRSTPTIALNVLFNILPIDIAAKKYAITGTGLWREAKGKNLLNS